VRLRRVQPFGSRAPRYSHVSRAVTSAPDTSCNCMQATLYRLAARLISLPSSTNACAFWIAVALFLEPFRCSRERPPHAGAVETEIPLRCVALPNVPRSHAHARGAHGGPARLAPTASTLNPSATEAIGIATTRRRIEAFTGFECGCGAELDSMAGSFLPPCTQALRACCWRVRRLWKSTTQPRANSESSKSNRLQCAPTRQTTSSGPRKRVELPRVNLSGARYSGA
jgi:hypothetical protein